MGRSQRHKLIVQQTTSLGEIYAEGVVAPAILRQLPGPPAPAIVTGAPGGPLQGSTVTGYVPPNFVGPIPKDGESVPAPGQSAPGEARTFPIGPLALLRVEPDPAGAWYVVDITDQIQDGDDVTIEATGSSATNGNYVAEQISSSATETRFFVPDVVLAAPIDAKGRVTVTDGAI